MRPSEDGRDLKTTVFSRKYTRIEQIGLEQQQQKKWGKREKSQKCIKK